VKTAATGLALALLAGCGQDQRVVGNGSETTTGITARVLGLDGKPVAGASVQLRPTTWIPDSTGDNDPVRQLATDTNGTVRFSAVSGGSWTLFAIGSDGRAIGRIDRGDQPASLVFELKLASSARLRGRVELPAGSRAWISASGLPGGVRPDTNGSFVLDGLPAGSHSIQVLSTGDTLRRCAKTVSVDPGSTNDAGLLVPRTRWASDGTTDSVIAEVDLGPSRPDTLVGYPLLLRLGDTSLDFSRTRGADLRISRGGRILSHHVEHWNPLDRTAAIWVRIDTLLPTVQKLSLRVGYGGTDAADWSDAASVFPISDGWVAAWHLDASDPGAEATGRHRAVDWRTTDATGIAGRGRFCDTGWLRLPDATDLRVQNLTVSCWARRKGNQIAIGKLISKGNLSDWHNTWALQEFDATSRIGFLSVRTDSVPDTLRARTALPDGAWSMATATWNARTGLQRLYVDGVAVDSSVQSRNLDYVNRPAIDMEVFLGANFIGTIDEARLSNVVRSPSWIFLDRWIQRPDAGVVRFLK